MQVTFDDKTRGPDDAALGRALGKAKKSWDDIVEHVKGLPGVSREWKFYGKKYGWQLKVADTKRALLYLVPHAGGFLAALALNDKAVAALRPQNLPASLIREIETAKAYPEGRPARIEVTNTKDAALVKKLLALKLRV
jgi:hypothetical protein